MHPCNCAQGDVGSVVKTDSDDDPIAIMSVLSTHKYGEANFMKQIRQFLLDSCPKQAIGGGGYFHDLEPGWQTGKSLNAWDRSSGHSSPGSVGEISMEWSRDCSGHVSIGGAVKNGAARMMVGCNKYEAK
eukprot:1156748-Pelagomonas_calceolata.AAC.16